MQPQQRNRWTAQQKAEALTLLASHGKAEAGRRTGIPVGTIASWGAREHVTSPLPEAMRPQVEARQLSLTSRKQALAEALIGDIGKLRAELFAEVVEKRVVTVRGGHADQGTVAEIVDVKHKRPPIADQKRLIEAIERAVATVQVLTGGLTASLGIVQEPVAEALEPSEKRGRSLAVVHQLADRARPA